MDVLAPLELALEVVLGLLIAAFAVMYLWNVVQLRRHARQAKQLLAELYALEEALQYGDATVVGHDRRRAIASLERVEVRVTGSAKRLLRWRSSDVERWIIGREIDPLLVDYERAGAMTSRLIALLSRPAAKQAQFG
jgi:hypothetical protein